MKKRLVSIIIAVSILLNAFSMLAFAQTQDEKELYNIEISGTANYEKAYELFDRINNYRSVNKFDKFKSDKRLMDAAMQRAAECAVYFSTARPNDIRNTASYETAIPEELVKGTQEFDTAYLRNLDELFNTIKPKFENLLKSGYKTIGAGVVYHNGIYYCTVLASNAEGQEEETRTLTKNTTKFSILCEKTLLEDIIPDPSNFVLEKGKSDCVFFEAVNLGWIDVKFIINPQKIEVSNDKVAKAEIMDNAVKITGLNIGEYSLSFTLNSVDGENSLTSVFDFSVKDYVPVVSDKVMGDINGDKLLTVVDAKWMLQIIAGTRKMTSDMHATIDVNHDGYLTVVDAKWVLQAIAGLRDTQTFEVIK